MEDVELNNELFERSVISRDFLEDCLKISMRVKEFNDFIRGEKAMSALVHDVLAGGAVQFKLLLLSYYGTLKDLEQKCRGRIREVLRENKSSERFRKLEVKGSYLLLLIIAALAHYRYDTGLFVFGVMR